MVRALAASAYRHGAKFVDVSYFDMHVKRARILHADEDTLDFVPPWYGERLLELGRQRCAAHRARRAGDARACSTTSTPRAPGATCCPSSRRPASSSTSATTNWTIVPYPTAAWARQVHPDVPEDEAIARLCEQILHVCRLDEEDPVAAWSERRRCSSAPPSG